MTGSTLSDWLWDRLQDLGVRHVFTVPAGQVEGLCRALSARQMPRAVVTVSEIGAGFMAEGAARVTGGPAVFLAGDSKVDTNMTDCQSIVAGIVRTLGNASLALSLNGCAQYGTSISQNRVIRLVQ